MANLGSFNIGIDAAAASALAAGTHTSTVSTTTSTGLNIDIPVNLVVDEMPDAILTSSFDGIVTYNGVETYASSFEAHTKSVQLVNNGPEGAPDITGTVTPSESWVVLSGDTSGTLNAEAANQMNFVIDVDRAALALLAIGNHSATVDIAFTDPFVGVFNVTIQVEVYIVVLPDANPRVTVIGDGVTPSEASKSVIFAGFQGNGASFTAMTDNKVLIENIAPVPAASLVGSTAYNVAYLNLIPDVFNISASTSVQAAVEIDEPGAGALALGPHNTTIDVTLDGQVYVINVTVMVFSMPTPITDDGQVVEVKNDPRYSEYTQHLMNQLPEWHVGRRIRDSLINRITDATSGRVLEDINSYELQNFVNHKFFSESNIFNPYEAFFLGVGQPVKSVVKPNLLRNSNFENWTNPSMLPDHWQLSMDDEEEHFDLIYATNTRNFLGGQLLQWDNVDPADPNFYSFGEIDLFQEVEFENEPAGTYTLQFWYDVTNATSLSYNQHLLLAKIEYTDGTVDTATPMVLPYSAARTTGKLLLNATKTVAKITVILRVDYKNALPISTINFSNFILHRGTTTQGWMPNENDRPSHVRQIAEESHSVFTTSHDGTFASRFIELDSDRDLHKRLLPNAATIDYFAPSVVTGTAPLTAPVLLPPHYHFTGERISHGIMVSTPVAQQYYDWPEYTLGRLVKFDLRHPQEITATYNLGFPIWSKDGYSSRISAYTLQCVTKHLGHLWVMAKAEPATSIRYTKNYGHALFVLDMNSLPKMYNTEEPDHENNPLTAQVAQSYFFESGAATSFDHYSLEFESRTRARTQMTGSYTSVIDLRYNYFVRDDDTSQIAILRDPRIDNGGSGIVVN